MATTYDMSMVRGDTFAFQLTFHDVNWVIDSLTFTIKKRREDKHVIVQKTLGDGITQTGEYEYVVRVAPEDTRGVSRGTYKYDVQLGTGDDIYTLFMGDLEIEKDVTDN